MQTAIFFLTALFLTLTTPCLAQPEKKDPIIIKNVSVGMSKGKFSKIYPKAKARTYRENSSEEWITFNHPLNDKAGDVVTFHLTDGKVTGWTINDRDEVISEYLGEFASQAFKQGFPTIDAAIRDVLRRIPYEDFLKITNRRRPVLFTEFFDSGTAKFANSSEIISLPDDAPAFQDGMTIIKLSTGLNEKQNQQAIEGVIAHEIAHRVLEHVLKGKRTCTAEREANELIEKWGFEKEYEEASRSFGHKAVGQVVSCPDE